MPEALKDAWPCWRLWLDKRVSLVDLQTTYSIDDVELMCIADDFLSDVRQQGKRQ